MKKEQAIEVKNLSLSAVRDLTNILHITEKIFLKMNMRN